MFVGAKDPWTHFFVVFDFLSAPATTPRYTALIELYTRWKYASNKGLLSRG